MNSAIGKNSIAAEILRTTVERIENIRAQKKALSDDESAVLAEAKARGMIPASIKFVIKKRTMKPSDRAEAENLEDLYMHAMGMASDTPLFRAVGLMEVDITAREAVVEAMKKFVPADGSIEVEAGGKRIRLTRDKDGNVTTTDVVERPASTPAATIAKPRADLPTCDGDGAEQLGREAFRADQPIIANPFPFNDARRARWDKGWRLESGGDGMDD